MLVRQLSEGITFAYDPHLGHSRDRLRGINEENNSENNLHHYFRYGKP